MSSSGKIFDFVLTLEYPRSSKSSIPSTISASYVIPFCFNHCLTPSALSKVTLWLLDWLDLKDISRILKIMRGMKQRFQRSVARDCTSSGSTYDDERDRGIFFDSFYNSHHIECRHVWENILDSVLSLEIAQNRRSLRLTLTNFSASYVICSFNHCLTSSTLSKVTLWLLDSDLDSSRSSSESDHCPIETKFVVPTKCGTRLYFFRGSETDFTVPLHLPASDSRPNLRSSRGAYLDDFFHLTPVAWFL